MKPMFALVLSFDGVALLRRGNGAWARLGHVGFGDDDPGPAVRALAEQARVADPQGHKVALILPDDQVKCIDLPDPGPPRTRCDAAVKLALDGATPYRLDELRFDWTRSADRLQAAAVARETLAEAEEFALQHGFIPLSHHAQPPRDRFDGVANFGVADAWDGTPPEPLDAPIRIQPPEANGAITTGTQTSDNAPVSAPSATLPDARNLAGESAVMSSSIPAPDSIAPHGDADAPADGPVSANPPASEPDAARTRAAALAQVTTLSQDATGDWVRADPDASFATAADGDSAANQAGAAASDPVATTANDDADVPGARNGSDATDPAPTETPPQAMPGFASRRAEGGGDLPPLPKPQAAGLSLTRPRLTPVIQTETRLRDAEVTASQLALPEEDTPTDTSPEKGDLTAQARTFLSKHGDAAKRLARRTRAGAFAALGRLKPSRAEIRDTATTPTLSSDVDDTAEQPRSIASDDVSPAVLENTAVSPAPPQEPKSEGRSAPLLSALRRSKAHDNGGTPAPAPARPTLPTAPPLKPVGQTTGSRSTPAAPLAPAALRVPGRHAPLSPEEERDRMTLFGQRNRDRSPQPVGMYVAAGVLLALGAVAGWALIFMDDRVASLFGDDSPPPAVAALTDPAATQEPVAPRPQSDIAEPDTPPQVAPDESAVDIAALEAPGAPPAPQPALSQPEPARALSAEEAAATYAATGIWQRAPVAPLEPTPALLGDVYVASIDPDVMQADAIALPNPGRMVREAALPDPAPTPPPGQVFDLDARGLVSPSEEGTLAPQGHRVYSGPPPAVPPLRDGTAPVIDSDQGAAPGIADAPASSLAAIRPEPRPDDLVESRQRTQLGGLTREELSQVQPALRPRTAQQEAEAADPETPATQQAVRASLNPLARPQDMQSIVARAERQREQQAVAAAPPPRTVAPAVPSGASVSREATVANAINLNRVNLIGVYGTPSNRRALVRLPNGDYEKVQVGDRIDGGRVAAIGDAELRYVKSGRNIVLNMPRG